MPEVSILIVNWNTKDLTEKAVASLFRHEDPSLFEVILVDNASRDGSVERLSARFPNIRIIANRENVGFARANNQAAASAQGRHLLLFNSDAYLTGPVLEACLAAARDRGPCILGCRLLNPDGSLQLSTEPFPTLAGYLREVFSTTGRSKASLLARQAAFGVGVHRVDWVTGAFLLMDAGAWLKVGGLSEGIFMYGEDMELCHRAATAGIPCYYAQGPAVTHLGGGSADYASMRFLHLTDTGRLRTFAAMRGGPAALTLRAIFILRSLVRVALSALPGLLPARRADRVRARNHFREILLLLGIGDARNLV